MAFAYERKKKKNDISKYIFFEAHKGFDRNNLNLKWVGK